MIPYSDKARLLMQEGAIALAQVEANGMKVDVVYLDNAIRKTRRRIKHLKRKIQTEPMMKKWRKVFKSKTNINSNEQLGKLLFDICGYESPGRTKTGKHKTDEASLGTVDLPFVKMYLRIKKLQKSEGTYLQGIRKETVNGYLHPSFNLHLVKTFRSSSDSPNFQNLPTRIEEYKRLIRRALIARTGHRILELDFGGIEVCVAACYHKDPALIAYLKDPTKDMHRDMAAECFMLTAKEMDWTRTDLTKPQRDMIKLIRYCGKNMFVFPEFYGAIWLKCAASLWEACETLKLKTVSGVPLREHLASKGITELGDQKRRGGPRAGTFEAHIQKIEDMLWKDMFPVYAQWKLDWYADYQRRGWLLTKTGFICQGFIEKNKVINYPVQGVAFHLLLKALILIQNEITKRGMSAKLIGQIHDSIVADVPEDEVDEFLQMAWEIMTVVLPHLWPWIIVPLAIDAEVTPVGGSWYEKEEWV